MPDETGRYRIALDAYREAPEGLGLVAVVDALWPLAVSAGREAAARAILDHAEQHAPNSGPYVPAIAALRRHLHMAARVAAGPMTTADVVDAIRQGNFAACYLDESGRPVDVEGETS
jgi:hypothetical protein